MHNTGALDMGKNSNSVCKPHCSILHDPDNDLMTQPLSILDSDFGELGRYVAECFTGEIPSRAKTFDLPPIKKADLGGFVERYESDDDIAGKNVSSLFSCECRFFSLL
jgi:hypothetical protein